MKQTRMMAVIVVVMVQAAASSPKAQTRPFSLLRAALAQVARYAWPRTAHRPTLDSVPD